jgi:radical SAM modification target selenobiotic family peptide
MDREELKKILASYGVAGLMAAGGIAVTAQPAMCA